jgi:hypothetical protein
VKVSRFEHRHRVLRRQDCRRSLHPIQPSRIDQSADGFLDGLERAEPLRPALQEFREVRWNGLSERETPLQLGWIKYGFDTVSVDGIGSVALYGIRHEIRRELDHARSRVLAPLLIEAHGDSLHLLEQCCEQKTNWSRADHVHSHAGGSLSEPFE